MGKLIDTAARPCAREQIASRVIFTGSFNNKSLGESAKRANRSCAAAVQTARGDLCNARSVFLYGKHRKTYDRRRFQSRNRQVSYIESTRPRQRSAFNNPRNPLGTREWP